MPVGTFSDDHPHGLFEAGWFDPKLPFSTLYLVDRLLLRDLPLFACVATDMSNPFMRIWSVTLVDAFDLTGLGSCSGRHRRPPNVGAGP